MALLSLLAVPAEAGDSWPTLGPEGGDVRRLTREPGNPDRVYLGTSAGQLLVSDDGGTSWTRLARLGPGTRYVLDNIAIHPRAPETVYVAAWDVEGSGGGLFRSRDRGHTWEALPGIDGKSLRSLALAPSDPRFVAVGALDGVFVSRDGGDTWQRISPQGHPDIKNIGSLAIDPRSTDIVYAGTWHLPWKTSDGGRTWQNIKTGLIDDSDIFSIVIDPVEPARVYVSACSGIYRSDDAGARFRKLPGIPFSARRTRVLHQDPADRAVLYAGTTEGLWKSRDGGDSWQLISPPQTVVNDVTADPRDARRVLVATDRSGVLRSQDAGATLTASNRGFAHRHVAAVLVDRDQPSTLYAGVVNDREHGGVFVSPDLGSSWRQIQDGLEDSDVFTLAQGDDGTLLAGTNQGMFVLDRAAGVWRPRSTFLTEITEMRKQGGREVPTLRAVPSEFRGRVFQFEVAPTEWLAATVHGLLVSIDRGRTWTRIATEGWQEIIGVRVSGDLMVAVARRAVLVSGDSGRTWNSSQLPEFLAKIYGVAIDGQQNIWLATREGALRSRDRGQSWERILGGLPARWVTSITWDPERQRLLATSSASPHLFQSSDGGHHWQEALTGSPLRAVASSRGRLVAATAFDGIILEPVVVVAQDEEAPGARPVAGGNSGECAKGGC